MLIYGIRLWPFCQSHISHLFFSKFICDKSKTETPTVLNDYGRFRFAESRFIYSPLAAVHQKKLFGDQLWYNFQCKVVRRKYL